MFLAAAQLQSAPSTHNNGVATFGHQNQVCLRNLSGLVLLFERHLHLMYVYVFFVQAANSISQLDGALDSSDEDEDDDDDDDDIDDDDENDERDEDENDENEGGAEEVCI